MEKEKFQRTELRAENNGPGHQSTGVELISNQGTFLTPRTERNWQHVPG